MMSCLVKDMEGSSMEKLKKIYTLILILLPILLVGTLSISSKEKIIIDTTNFQVARGQLESGQDTLTIEVYGEGFKEGDCIYIDGEKQDTTVVYNKMLTFKLPKSYMQSTKVRIKVQRMSQTGIAKETSNTHMMQR